MKNLDLYTSAHLIVAAIRILEYRNTAPPLIDEVCKEIPYSLEQGNLICKKLKELGIIEIIDGAYGARLCITDHLKMEDIPRGVTESSIKEDLKRFQDNQKNFTKKVESIQATQAKKQKDLFAEIEEKLKKGIEKER